MDSLPLLDAFLSARYQTAEDEEARNRAAWLAHCEAAADDLRAQAARWWQTAQHGKARFSTCQHIAGEPTPRDDCKCGAPTASGAVYCADHQALCFRAPKPDKADFDLRPLAARAA